MGIQKINCQREEKEEVTERELNEKEAFNISKKEFRIRILQFTNWVDEKINNLCKNQEEIKSDIHTIKKQYGIFHQ